jgi:tetratricopeptide (TPR) repeat protein
LKRWLNALIIASIAVLSTACIAPVRYDVEVHVAPDGSYALRYEGTVAHAPLRVLLLEGESEIALFEEAQSIATELAEAPGVQRVIYVGGGIFRVLGEITVDATETESFFGVLTVMRDSDGLVFQTEGFSSDVWETYEALELEHDGHVTIRSEAIVRYSNGEGGPREFTWSAEALRGSGISFRAYIPTDAERQCFREPTADCFLALALDETSDDPSGSARLMELVARTMYHHYLELGEFRAAAGFLDAMSENAATNLGQRLVTAQLQIGDFEGARRTALEIESLELVSNTVEGLVAMGEVDEAWLLVSEAYPVGSEWHGEVVGVVVTQQLAGGDEAGASQTILAAWDALRETTVPEHLIDRVFAPYVRAFAETGLVTEAQALFDEASASTDRTERVSDALHHGRFLSFLRSERYSDAIDEAREIETSWVRNQLLEELIASAIERSDLALALRAAAGFGDPSPWQLAPILTAQVASGDVEAARATLSLAPESSAKQAHEVVILAAAGRWDDALTLTESIDAEVRDFAFGAIAIEQVEAEAFEAAVPTIARLTGTNSSFIGRLVDDMLDAGAVDHAYALIAAVGADSEQDPGVQSLVRFVSNAMIETQAMAGDIEGAWRSVAVLGMEGSGSYEIVAAQLASGDLDGAATSVARMEPADGSYWSALRDLAIAQAKDGNFEDALRTIESLEATSVIAPSSVGTECVNSVLPVSS